MMKRVCIVRQGYFPVDVRVRKEALALASSGYRVDLICLKEKDEKAREVYRGVNVYRIPIRRSRKGVYRYACEYGIFLCLSTIRLSLLHFRNRYDFVQVNTLPDFLVFCTVIPRLLGAKVILDLHEPTPELFSTLFGKKRRVFVQFLKFLEKISIRYANKVITVSEEMKDNYVSRGAPCSKIHVILNVPNLEFNRELYHGELDRKDGKFMMVCHGAMLERYGQDIAIKAVDILKDKIPEIELNILGLGEYEPVLKDLVSKLGLGDYVRFRGFIPFLDMVRMIGKCDIGIVPIRKNSYSDLVHTNKMFEFIAMKRPVVISMTNAVENFFGSDGDCLKFFESANEKDLARGILELYHSPENRREMANNAFARFKTVRWKNMQEIYLDIFRAARV